MNTLELAKLDVDNIIKAALELAHEAETIVDFFKTYVDSATDTSGHELFLETGGADASFNPLIRKAHDLRGCVEYFTNRDVLTRKVIK